MKTACEEVTNGYCGNLLNYVPSSVMSGPERERLYERLRSEARELKRLRRMVVRLNDEQFKYKFAERVPLFMAVRREAARIQKARKAK